MSEYKQVLLIRHDLKMPKGKIAAQAAHASVEGVLLADKEVVRKWRYAGMKKIAVKIADEKELILYVQEAKNKGLPAAFITDAGKTVVAPGTMTCGVIGPALEEECDVITKDLPLL